MKPPRALFWLGPGADDTELVRRLIAAGGGRILDPDRAESALCDENGAAQTTIDDSVRGLIVRDTRLLGPRARRNLRMVLGVDGLVVQIVREPIEALTRELHRQQAVAIARRWTSPGNAGSTELQVTDRMIAERVLPRLAYDRRGRAFTPSRGRRVVLDRDELGEDRTRRLLSPVDAWLAALDMDLDWETIGPGHESDGTDVLRCVARGPIQVEGASVHVDLIPVGDLTFRRDLLRLAHVPSIASRVGFVMEATPLVLVAECARLDRIPRGLRHALTDTGVVQHLLEEELLPRWVERTEQIHRELARQPQVSPALAQRIRRALRAEMDQLFELRPTLRPRWGQLAAHAIAP